MNKTIKKWLIAASVLLLSGALLFVIAFAALDFKFADIGTHKYETNIYELSEDFDHIRVNVIDARITFAASHDGKCRIECLEQENLKHSAMVQNGVLVIGNTDARKWYDSFGVSFESETVTVYLPKAEYNSLLIKSDTGDVEIPESLSFESIQTETDTADVVCDASVSGSAEFYADTGDISVRSKNIKGSVSVETNMGDISLTGLRCKEISAETETGDIVMQSTVAANSITIKSDTGNVMLDRCDAMEITAVTDTGDIDGSLLSGKTFYATSSVGNIDIPKTSTGGKCKLTTDSGNIKVSVGDRYD